MAFLEIERLHKHYGPAEVLKEYNVHFAGAILAALPPWWSAASPDASSCVA